MSEKRSSSVSKEQASRWINETAEKTKSDRRKVDETPPPSEWKKAFGDKCKLSDDGRSFDLKLSESLDIKRAIEMQDGSRTEEIRRGAEVQARWDGKREKVVRRDGHVMDFPEELMDQVKHKFRPAGRNGGAPSVRFGMSDSYRKYEQGPDGLWFVWNDGWEPTTLFVRDQPLAKRQRDPDDNVWIRVDHEWVLEDEGDGEAA